MKSDVHHSESHNSHKKRKILSPLRKVTCSGSCLFHSCIKTGWVLVLNLALIKCAHTLLLPNPPQKAERREVKVFDFWVVLCQVDRWNYKGNTYQNIKILFPMRKIRECGLLTSRGVWGRLKIDHNGWEHSIPMFYNTSYSK